MVTDQGAPRIHLPPPLQYWDHTCEHHTQPALFKWVLGIDLYHVGCLPSPVLSFCVILAEQSVSGGTHMSIPAWEAGPEYPAVTGHFHLFTYTRELTNVRQEKENGHHPLVNKSQVSLAL